MVKEARLRRRAFLIDAILLFFNLGTFVAIVAQLVRALACGAGGRLSESGLSPHLFWRDFSCSHYPVAGVDDAKVTEALNLF